MSWSIGSASVSRTSCSRTRCHRACRRHARLRLPSTPSVAASGSGSIGVPRMSGRGPQERLPGTWRPSHAVCFPGKVVASYVTGTEKTYRFQDDNPMVEMLPCDVTNDTARIRCHPQMTAINSAIQVNLTGQVCTHSIGHKVYSGVGGQMDFMRGAGWDALADRARAASRCRRDNDADARALRGHRVRHGRPARPERARARPCADRADCAAVPRFREELTRGAHAARLTP